MDTHNQSNPSSASQKPAAEQGVFPAQTSLQETIRKPRGGASNPSTESWRGFVQLVRGGDAEELIRRNHHAFVLLTIIALRARRTTKYHHNELKLGEALIGDHKTYGMTEREYRTAKKVLSEAGFSTFEATSRGTIATLLNARVYNINLEEGDDQGDEPATHGGRPFDGRATSNNKANKSKIYEEVKKPKARNCLVRTDAEEELCRAWARAYKDTFSKDYYDQGDLDTRAAKELLKLTGLEPERLAGEAKTLWRSNLFYSDKAVTLSIFLKHVNVIRAQLPTLAKPINYTRFI